MCRGLNPDFSTWPKQWAGKWGERSRGKKPLGTALHLFRGVPPVSFVPTAAEQAPLAAASLFPPCHLCLLFFYRATRSPGSCVFSVWAPSHWASAAMIVGGDFCLWVMKCDIYHPTNPHTIRFFFLKTSHGIVSFCSFSVSVRSCHLGIYLRQHFVSLANSCFLCLLHGRGVNPVIFVFCWFSSRGSPSFYGRWIPRPARTSCHT